MNRSVDFYFDLSSPYSYLAATQIGKMVARHGAELRWRPVVLAAVFKAAGNSMPAQSPPKAKYMFDDLQRWAKRLHVPFTFTTRFPVNAMKAHRLLCACELAHGPGEAARLARVLFDALWTHDQDLTSNEVLEKLTQQLGLPGATLLAATEAQSVKDRLRANTDEAIARGMFGAPAFYVGDELYFGNDRLDFVEQAITRPA